MNRGAFSFSGRIDLPMSLKAKLEAVVYAAEEPVTLAQLATIFAEEVLQGLAEETPAEADSAPAMNEASSEETPAVEAAEPVAGEPLAVEPVAPDAVATEPAATEPAATEPAATEPVADEGDEKKTARQRDRRVRQVLQVVLDELIADYANSERGMEIREIAGGYRMATKPEYHDAVRGFVKSLKPPMKLSLQALETLAVIAYKQPVTAPEVSEIRGVDSGGVLGGLVSRKLITTAGRKPVIGRPILYKTTKEFLLRFGLKDVNDLPSMEEFEKMAGELAESEAEGEVQDAGMRSSEELASLHAAESSEEDVAEQSEATSETDVSEAGPEAVATTEAEPSAKGPDSTETESSTETEHSTAAEHSTVGES
jgi:segregation and condensation protein B